MYGTFLYSYLAAAPVGLGPASARALGSHGHAVPESAVLVVPEGRGVRLHSGSLPRPDVGFGPPRHPTMVERRATAIRAALVYQGQVLPEDICLKIADLKMGLEGYDSLVEP